jgi:hypothetical protein
VAASVAALEADQARQLRQRQQQHAGPDGAAPDAPHIPIAVAQVAAADVFTFLDEQLLALPPRVAARRVAAAAPLVGLLPVCSALVARASLESLAKAAQQRAGGAPLVPKTEPGLPSPGARGVAEASPARPTVKAEGVPLDEDEEEEEEEEEEDEQGGDDARLGALRLAAVFGGGSGGAAERAADLSWQRRRVQRRLRDAAATAVGYYSQAQQRRRQQRRMQQINPIPEELLVVACAEALLAHAPPPQQQQQQQQDDGWGGGGCGGELPRIMQCWLHDSSPALLRRLLALQPRAELASEWQGALLGELSHLVTPAATGQLPTALAVRQPPAWLTCRLATACDSHSSADSGSSGASTMLQMPLAPALLDAVLRSLAPCSEANGEGVDGQAAGSATDQELRLPSDSDVLARCGLQLCAILLQAVRGVGGAAAAAANGQTDPPAAAERLALLLSRVQAARVLQRWLLQQPALGVLLALMHHAGGVGSGSSSAAGACACQMAAGGGGGGGGAFSGGGYGGAPQCPPCGSRVCAALADIERDVAALGGGWWVREAAEQLLAPLQLLLCQEHARLEKEAAAALGELLDGGNKGSDAGCGGEQHQGGRRHGKGKAGRRSQDASAFVVVWSTPGGTAAGDGNGDGFGQGGFGASSVSSDVAALQLLPPWLLQPAEPLPVQAACRLVELAVGQIDLAAETAAAAVAAAGVDPHCHRDHLDVIDGEILEAAAQGAWAAVGTAAAALTSDRRAADPATAAAVTAACYSLHHAAWRLLAVLAAAPPAVAPGDQAAVEGAAAVASSGRAKRRAASGTPGSASAPRTQGRIGASPAAALNGGADADDQQQAIVGADPSCLQSEVSGGAAAVDGLLRLAGHSLDVCARAVAACIAAAKRQQQQQQQQQRQPASRPADQPLVLSLHLAPLAEAVSPEYGRLPAALAALKSMHGRGVSLGSHNFHAAKRGAVAQPLLSARVAVAMRALQLARWQAAREAVELQHQQHNKSTAEGDSQEGEEDQEPPVPAGPAAPLLTGLLRLQSALEAAWAVDRTALFSGQRAGEPAHVALDADRCEQMLIGLTEALVTGESRGQGFWW